MAHGAATAAFRKRALTLLMALLAVALALAVFFSLSGFAVPPVVAVVGLSCLVLGLGIVWVLLHRCEEPLQAGEETNAALRDVPGGVMYTLTDPDGTILRMNEGLPALLGYSREEMRQACGDKLSAMVHEDEFPELRQTVIDQLAAKQSVELEYRMRRKDGAWLWVMQRSAPAVLDGRECLCSTVQDISEQKQLIQQMLIGAESLRLLLDISGSSLFDLDLGTGLILFSQDFSELYGWPQHLENFPQAVLDEALVAEEDVPAFLASVDRLYDGHTFSNAEFRVRDSQGQLRWVSMAAAVIFDGDNEAVRVVGKLEDIDKRRRSLEALQQQSMRDGFTGLYNKAAAAHLIGEAMAQTQDAMGALFIVDVDNFKTLNDTLGHPVGDLALKELSESLADLFRSHDIVGRLGGDEFIAFMGNVREYESCSRKAARICEAFRRSYGPPERTVHVSASVGVALFPSDGQEYASLYAAADAALYEAKRNGKDRYAMFHTAVAEPEEI